ncbi:MAG: resolvase, partial [Rickettsiaceae bacterium]|nr:resolvase [Rickettsiaceae bacterium]
MYSLYLSRLIKPATITSGSLLSIASCINSSLKKLLKARVLLTPNLAIATPASLTEFERDIIKERTNAGLKAARARGRLGGRPKGLSPQAESTSYAAAALYKEGQLSIKQ